MVIYSHLARCALRGSCDTTFPEASSRSPTSGEAVPQMRLAYHRSTTDRLELFLGQLTWFGRD
jgi:hypothetical protein